MSLSRRLATLSAPSESVTPYGGRSVSWNEVATLWLDLRPVTRRQWTRPDGPPQTTETLDAEARDHPDAAPGQRLSVDGQTWRLVAVQRALPAAGRMTLTLERDLP